MKDVQDSRGFRGETPAPPPGRRSRKTTRVKSLPSAAPSTESWPPVIALSDFRVTPFPLDVLPGRFREVVEAMAQSTNTPPEWAAMGALTIVAGTAARRMRVQVTENYLEPMALYTLLIGESGTGKSPLVDMLLAPVREIESRSIEDAEPEIADAETEKKIADRRLAILRDRAANTKDDDEFKRLIEHIRSLQADLRAVVVPPRPCLICDNVTSERLRTDLAEQGRLILASAEGGDQLAVMSGRYSTRPNFDVLLNGDSEDFLDVRRMGRQERVERPALTVLLGIQPRVLGTLAAVPGVVDRGLLNRFFFVWAPTASRPAGADSYTAELRDWYRDDLDTLLTNIGEPSAVRDPHVLRLSDAARELYEEARQRLEAGRLRDGEQHALSGAISKMQGRLLRVAGALHLAGDPRATEPWGVPIDATTMENASRLVEEYLLPNTEMTFGRLNADPALEGAKRLWRNIVAMHVEHFSRGELWNRVKNGLFPTSGAMDPGLAVLVEHGHIRQRRREGHGPGRPAQIFDVNPAALSN